MFKNKIWAPLLALVLAYTIFGLVLFIFQNNFIYPSSKLDFNNCKELNEYEKININNFRGYLFKRSSENLLVYYSGNGGRACDRHYMNTYFKAFDYSVLFVEYPGYGEAKDTSMEKILSEVKDINNFIEKGSFQKITIVGESLGTGPASYHAYLNQNKIDKIILITPYDNLINVVKSHYPIYPVNLMLKNNFIPDIWLKNINAPITLIIAENDEVVGAKQGRNLYDSIPQNNKEIYEVKESGHNSIYGKKEFSEIFLKNLSI